MNKLDAAALLIIGGLACLILGVFDAIHGPPSMGALGVFTGVWCIFQGVNFLRDAQKRTKR